MEFAVVDIETTGGSAKNERIIEIAILITNGEKILETYQTLINPERPIPTFITTLTGINDQMVEDAPSFNEVAPAIDRITKDRIFVAHSVNFDYSFVRNEFMKLGFSYDRRRLCTVRLSRKIFPGLPSYGLGKLCEHFNIQNDARHRAFGDAQATTILLNMLVERDHNDHIDEFLRYNSKESKLPPNISLDEYNNLPETAGVYYFLDEKKKIIYVGKAKNIKKRINSHFSISGSGGEKNNFINTVFSIEYVETGNELVALLLEASEIKKHWPEYNRSQKKPSFNYALYGYEDSLGYKRFTIAKAQKGWQPIMTFQSLQDAKNVLYDVARDHQLCPKLCGLQPAKEACFDHHIGKCQGACVGKVTTTKYNELVNNALDEMDKSPENYVILGHGRQFGEKTCVLVEDGIYKGFGFVDWSEDQVSGWEWKDKISLYKETPEIKSILKTFPSGKQEYEILNLDLNEKNRT